MRYTSNLGLQDVQDISKLHNFLIVVHSKLIMMIMKFFLWFVETQVNSVNCNTSWKVVLFMKWSDNKETILKGVGRLFL